MSVGNKKDLDILFIDPFYSLDKKNTHSIACLRGHLESKGFSTDTINFNKVLNNNDLTRLDEVVKREMYKKKLIINTSN